MRVKSSKSHVYLFQIKKFIFLGLVYQNCKKNFFVSHIMWVGLPQICNHDVCRERQDGPLTLDSYWSIFISLSFNCLAYREHYLFFMKKEKTNGHKVQVRCRPLKWIDTLFEGTKVVSNWKHCRRWPFHSCVEFHFNVAGLDQNTSHFYTLVIQAYKISTWPDENV